MRFPTRHHALALAAVLIHLPAWAGDFTLSSTDVSPGQPIDARFVFKGFGCEGGNLSPALSWTDPPAGTKSFALTVYDPDAPTGSGWWHWVVVNLPAQTTGLPTGAGGVAGVPEGARQVRTDFGTPGYGGPCPPVGDAPHRYVFTLYALKVPALALPEPATAAMAGFMIHANALGRASFTATYGR
ncbi:YbhB/YbcL family Raf kinase inhibitor-like protein [Nitrogeniibacter mangrovi]|uniref:YbhB/YbcL family Raf kinase inhibitor-like protein n=1 Tax=Nitrogeniibacter mangrovi TaxID=2016596 RepID=A0A6C1AYS5_9RHOO|nr:YbhB/YbcL family Raf kinase inhibitor-like protein [Nitrogeniibacter mangrovi]QID16521.1 YbhB/YbcL family Raf kinase inhibitor-like protein [Nitrogeniibacter mangrovi]